MRIDRVGSSMFHIKTPGKQSILIDPWISGNPTVTKDFKSRENLKQIDMLLVSHAHLDHAKGVMEIAELNPAITVVCHMEFGSLLEGKGLKNVERLNIGGTIEVGDTDITFVTAAHSSSFGVGPDRVWAGPAVGIIVTPVNGRKIYYAGDTGLTADMRLIIGDYYRPDIAILPVGGHVTMDLEQAAYAAGELIRPRKVIPFHYFPDPKEAPDPVGMAKFLELYPIARPLVGDKGKKFKALMEKQYPEIETVVLELGEGIDV